MRVLALTRYGRLGASSRLRFYQYVPRLQPLGIDVLVSPLLSDNYLRRYSLRHATNWFAVFGDYLMQAIRLLSAREFELVWIEKELFPNLPAWFEQVLNTLGIGYVVDYDDAIFHNYDLSSQPFKGLLADKIDKVMRNSAVVTCGNDYLAERARSAGARAVEIIPTVIDLDRYTVSIPAARERIVVGWIGSPSTVRYLEFVAPALLALSAEYAVQLRVIGAQFVSPGLEVDCRPWSEESEVIEIQRFDIGIMPLNDSPWERGKCGYKLIQYMACGLPVIASPVGVNRNIVEHEVSGYLATTSDDWLTALRALSADAETRRAMGMRGRSTVEQHYCLPVTTPRLARIFREALAQKAT